MKSQPKNSPVRQVFHPENSVDSEYDQQHTAKFLQTIAWETVQDYYAFWSSAYQAVSSAVNPGS